MREINSQNRRVSIYKITGGKKLQGAVKVAGAKNAATKEIVASLLTREKCRLGNVPRIGDIEVTLEMCKLLGSNYSWTGDGALEIENSALSSFEIPFDYTGINRIPILLLGPLLHRFGKAVVPVPGGCRIGPRPVDFHIQALQRLGASVELKDEKFIVHARKLSGNLIELPYPSVGATENIIITATLAEGTTTIKNAAVEPEVIDLISFLQSMGAIIYVDVDRKIVVEGVKELNGAAHRVINDRIEAASFASLAAVTEGDVMVEGASQDHMLTFLNYYRKVGGRFRVEEDGIHFFSAGTLTPVAMETDVHPWFMTDWQQPFAVMLTQADGLSVIHETVYENRFGYAEELKRMGAEIQLYNYCLGNKPCRFSGRDYKHSCVIKGKSLLKGREIRIPDLRAGFSYLIAAAIAEGVSEIHGVEYIERGYENIFGKFKALGADIEVCEK
ncbi:MAG: UDP-N-acetylglucosamine 1-carboxyvinyltransferase [Nitrospinae bacterium]|nr:UDP-N-acetylglucosamine 1-carboxyvinyltransferase [Nitrospinota bacterium]